VQWAPIGVRSGTPESRKASRHALAYPIRENERLSERLRKAEIIMDEKKEVASLLGRRKRGNRAGLRRPGSAPGFALP
jgi:hypothetical protein